MNANLFEQFVELSKEGNAEHCERTFVKQNGKMYYQPYGSDYYYRGNNLDDGNKWLGVFMGESPLLLTQEQKEKVEKLEEFVHEF